MQFRNSPKYVQREPVQLCGPNPLMVDMAPRVKKKSKEGLSSSVPQSAQLSMQQYKTTKQGSPLKDVSAVAATILVNSLSGVHSEMKLGIEEVGKDRMQTLNDIKTRVSSLRNKIRSNISETGAFNIDTNYLIQNKRAGAGGLPGMHTHQERDGSSNQSNYDFVDLNF